jgi:hypothetical protein
MCKKKQYISVSPTVNENSNNDISQNYTNILITNPYVLGGGRNPDNFQENLILTMPNDLLSKAINLDRMDCNIKIICLCDFFASFYYSAINLFFGILIGIISLNGYFASINHNKNGMFCYMLYQYFQVFTKFLSIFAYIFYRENSVNTLEFNNSTNASNVSIFSPNNSYNYIIENRIIIIPLLCTFFLVQCYLCYFVRKYYNLLPTKEDIRRLGGFIF